MKDIFGISLADTEFQLIHVFADDNLKTLQTLKNYSYLSNTAFDNALNPENLTHISDIILNYKNKNHISELGINFSIPVNFAKTKRVAVPLDASPTIIHNQIEWELNNYLGSSKGDYKIIKTEKFGLGGVIAYLLKYLTKNISQMAKDKNPMELYIFNGWKNHIMTNQSLYRSSNTSIPKWALVKASWHCKDFKAKGYDSQIDMIRKEFYIENHITPISNKPYTKIINNPKYHQDQKDINGKQKRAKYFISRDVEAYKSIAKYTTPNYPYNYL